ncbi:hypothetical protein L211DRAFT_810031 [Terfezia boudieri ATCC MYA-4762]|uniref:Uncharacterized protein n=1 Tax=Terfezia boudieri ATCC MYA-4762 TaxID=1051890 RepID=A0A3N4LK78_9PEZI|nr:hypothetical protein L211DRAFT_810031 [Terfezia boudieri ATCC MYA-4762]
MSGPAGMRRPICVFCRHLPSNPSPIITSAARWTPELLGTLAFIRPASTRVYIPKRYGRNVGRTPEKELENRLFVKLMRSQEEPPVATAEHPGSSKATFDLRMGRFYDIDPVEAISDILAHDFPEDYFWPNPRSPPEAKSRRTWRDINWLGWDAPALSGDRKGIKLKVG